MKRALSLLLTVIALLYPAALAGAEAIGEWLEQITALLEQRESLYELRDGAYDALEAFGERNDYPSLLNARLVCDEALQSLPYVVRPSLTLSDEALRALLQAGVETDALEEAFLAEPETAARIDLTMYDSLLYSSVYQLSMLDTLRDWISISRRRLALDVAYDGLLVNALLLPVADDPAVAAFWGGIPDRWPLIGGGISCWEADRAALIGDSAALLREMDSLADEAAVAEGRDAYASERYATHVKNFDFAALKADANPIAGMPIMLPLPTGWLRPNDTQLFGSYEEKDESGMPDGLMMRTADVTAADLHAYVETLEALKIPLYSREGSDEAGWRIIFALGERVLIIRWSPDRTATIMLDPRELSLEAYIYLLCIMT